MFGRTRARPSLSVTGQPKLAQWSMFVGLVVSGSRYAHYVDELVLACLAEAEIHLQHLVELPDHTELSAWHAQQHAMVSDYLQYRKDPQGSFADWCEQRQRRHPWVATYSYGGDD